MLSSVLGLRSQVCHIIFRGSDLRSHQKNSDRERGANVDNRAILPSLSAAAELAVQHPVDAGECDVCLRSPILPHLYRI